MKKTNTIICALTAALLLTASVSAFSGCQTPGNDGEGKTESSAAVSETEPGYAGLILDGTACIMVGGESDEITRNAADLVAAAMQDSHETAWENLSTVDYTYHDYERDPNKRTLDHIFHNNATTPSVMRSSRSSMTASYRITTG